MQSWMARLGLGIIMVTMLLALAAPVALAQVLDDEVLSEDIDDEVLLLPDAEVDVDFVEVPEDSELEGDCFSTGVVSVTCYVEDDEDEEDEDEDEDDDDDDEDDEDDEDDDDEDDDDEDDDE